MLEFGFSLNFTLQIEVRKPKKQTYKNLKQKLFKAESFETCDPHCGPAELSTLQFPQLWEL